MGNAQQAQGKQGKKRGLRGSSKDGKILMEDHEEKVQRDFVPLPEFPTPSPQDDFEQQSLTQDLYLAHSKAVGPLREAPHMEAESLTRRRMDPFYSWRDNEAKRGLPVQDLAAMERLRDPFAAWRPQQVSSPPTNLQALMPPPAGPPSSYPAIMDGPIDSVPGSAGDLPLNGASGHMPGGSAPSLAVPTGGGSARRRNHACTAPASLAERIISWAQGQGDPDMPSGYEGGVSANGGCCGGQGHGGGCGYGGGSYSGGPYGGPCGNERLLAAPPLSKDNAWQPARATNAEPDVPPPLPSMGATAGSRATWGRTMRQAGLVTGTSIRLNQTLARASTPTSTVAVNQSMSGPAASQQVLNRTMVRAATAAPAVGQLACTASAAAVPFPSAGSSMTARRHPTTPASTARAPVANSSALPVPRTAAAH